MNTKNLLPATITLFAVLFFTAGAGAQDNVGINTAAPIATLDVRNSTGINSVYVTNTSTNTTQFGVRSYVNGVAAGSTRIAGEFLATGAGNNNTGTSSSATNGLVNYGGTFTATGGTSTNIGTWGFASGPGGATNYAVYGSIGASSSGNDWAGYFRGRLYASNRVVMGVNENNENAQLTVRTPDTSYNAIFASTANGGGNGMLSTYVGSPNVYYAFWGIAPTTNQNYAGYFSGSVYVSGTFTNPSDERLKQNVQPLSGALANVMKLGVHTYNFRPEYSSMNLAPGKQFGYIAQNMEKVFPELVHNTTDKSGGRDKLIKFKAVNYIGMVPILTKALQEEHEELVKTQDEVQDLKVRIAALEQLVMKNQAVAGSR